MSNVEGLSQLLSKLQAISDNANEVLSQSLETGGKLVQGDAKKICPTDTGQLINSIEVTKQDDLTVEIGTNVEYAVFVEFGTGDKGGPEVEHSTKSSWVYKDKDGNFKTAKAQGPRPFLRKALNSNKKKIVKLISKRIKSELMKKGGG